MRHRPNWRLGLQTPNRDGLPFCITIKAACVRHFNFFPETPPVKMATCFKLKRE